MDGSRIRKEKIADSKISGYVSTGPIGTMRNKPEITSQADKSPGEGGTLGIFGWGCAAGTLELLAYTRASSAQFCYPILDLTPQISLILE